MNYISTQKIKAMTKDNFDCVLNTINVNGCKRGCSGFLVNKITKKICYITTEPFASYGGAFGNPQHAIMMRTATSIKDYTGGRNQWLSIHEISQYALKLTS